MVSPTQTPRHIKLKAFELETRRFYCLPFFLYKTKEIIIRYDLFLRPDPPKYYQ